ncbi:MAG TPA: DMT family transporter [Acidimicrobiia bacterium]|nr:DMT family transporter [Acidimicrobiia bacterium]
MLSRTALAGLAIAAASFLFGSTFVVIKDAVATFPPISFVAWRFLLGGLALVLFAPPKGTGVWRDGAIAGSLLFVGYSLQTAGLVTTGASNSALITGLFVIFTPLLAALLYRRSPSLGVAAAAVLAFAGVFLLTYRPRTEFVRGDLLTVGAAAAFAGHIIALDRLANRHSLVSFTAVQLLVTGFLAFPLAAIVEGIPTPGRREVPALLVTALGVSIGAYILQLWAQTIIGPSRTAVLLALEPAFAVATAAVVLSERLSPAGWAGATLIMGAILLVTRFGAAEVAGKGGSRS